VKLNVRKSVCTKPENVLNTQNVKRSFIGNKKKPLQSGFFCACRNRQTT